MKNLLVLLLGVIIAYAFTSCESEEDFGFPPKIELSGKGETIHIKGSNDLSPSIILIELLNYDGDGNNDRGAEDRDYFETSTGWLTVKYYPTEYEMVLVAQPNETNKNRKLYLYLYDGKSRQEITFIQSK